VKPARLLTSGDWCLVAFLLAATVFSYLPRQRSVPDGTQILILSNGSIVQSLDPAKDAEGSVQGPLGLSRYGLQGGGIRMKDSPCPNKTCVRMGKIRRSGDMIVCVPNRVVIRIVRKGQTDLDGVTF